MFRPKRYKVAYGGRGKGASWSIARALLVMGYQRPIRVLCTREVQKSIRDSVHRLLCDQIELLGLGSAYQALEREIRGPRGTLFLFEGLHRNVRRIKSMEGIDVAWVAEGEKVSANSWDILIPTVRKDGSEIWCDFNPDEETDETYQRFVANPPPDAIVRHLTWRDNPWFPDVLRAEMEYMRSVDPDAYDWIWEGKPRQRTAAQVFRGKYRIERFETPGDMEEFYPGADWGFSQDPTALIRPFITTETRETSVGEIDVRKLWIDREAGGLGIELEELPQLFDHILPHQKWPIVADSSRPETIAFMKRRGYNVLPSIKGKGSIEDGVEFIRSFDEIVIHPECQHTIDEFKLYSYKIDPNSGDVLPIIVDRNNHWVDALRYGLERVRRRSPKIKLTGRLL